MSAAESPTSRTAPRSPLRLLVVLPSWVGDCVMATPSLGLLRQRLPGAYIACLARPGMDQLLAGMPPIDEFHVERASGVMGPKFVAAKLRPRRYDTALLLTNSFSTALVTRIAGIPRRMGYDRDGRFMLLSDRLEPPRDRRGFAPVPAVVYYWDAARALTSGEAPRPAREWSLPDHPELPGALLSGEGVAQQLGLPQGTTMHLAIPPAQQERAQAILARIPSDAGPLVLLNPGANHPSKRWPAQHFAALADHLSRAHGATILLSGSPAEAELITTIVRACEHAVPISLIDLGIDLASLKSLLARCALVVTNDTGPRHMAVALGVPTIALLGPTDYRWAIIPTHAHAPEVILPADPTLPRNEVANDHPQRCSVERISLERVASACAWQLSRINATPPGPR